VRSGIYHYLVIGGLMAQKSQEHKIQNQIRDALSDHVRMVFRANVGQGWTANKEDTFRPSKSTAVVIERGDVLLRNARPFNTGLPAGFPDTFGCQELVITPEMVGQKVAVFWGIEIKDLSSASQAQSNFINALLMSGGKGGIARSPEEACSLLGVPYEPHANRRSR